MLGAGAGAMNANIPLVLRNDWLEENQIEIRLMYAYDYNESILISSPKNRKKDIPLTFYRLTYDPNERVCLLNYKIREVTLANRREVKRFIATMNKVIEDSAL